MQRSGCVRQARIDRSPRLVFIVLAGLAGALLIVR